ncbi:MAG: N-acetylmuramoyl-L-alanine amidase [Clostridia bacterium]|nr:N-acetylmuramoyl-L-alanine amidase [Clostridia bacterium]
MIKIFIDQGHNPQNPNAGAEGNGYREQDITYKIGVELARLLNANPNFEARLSRNSPTEILGKSNAESLRIRVGEANAYGADAFISIHLNASNITSATGSEAFVFRLGNAAEELASDILLRLTEATGYQNRGVFARPTLYVLRKTQMPATLLEVGYISNPGEARFMNDNPGLYARGIYNGILTYYGFQ